MGNSEAIGTYLDNIFAAYPASAHLQGVKAQLAADMQDKYAALVASGRSADEALGVVIAEFGSVDELIAEFGLNGDAGHGVGVEVSDAGAKVGFDTGVGPATSARPYPAGADAALSGTAEASHAEAAAGPGPAGTASWSAATNQEGWTEELGGNGQRPGGAKPTWPRFMWSYWPMVVAAYFVWSFAFNGWDQSWMLFPIAGVVWAGIWSYWGWGKGTQRGSQRAGRRATQQTARQS